ncbi:MAG: hypothetical protein RIK87_15445 [Fuerstiella sp.]
MADLTNPRLICLKGALFLVCGLLAAGILIAESPRWKTVGLLILAVWSFCRCYYFAFYVIQHYVDDRFRYAGLLHFAIYFLRSRRDQHSKANDGS